MRSIPNFKERKLNHQIHRIKLETDIASATALPFLLWRDRIAPALVAGFLPPITVTGVMIWPPNVENVRNSPLGKYVSKCMTPTIEVVRLLTLVPRAWGAWTHHIWLIGLVCTRPCGFPFAGSRRSSPLREQIANRNRNREIVDESMQSYDGIRQIEGFQAWRN